LCLECTAHRYTTKTDDPVLTLSTLNQRTWSFGDHQIDLTQHKSDPLSLQFKECLRTDLNQEESLLCSITDALDVMVLLDYAEQNRL
jgi:hypothetical protein